MENRYNNIQYWIDKCKLLQAEINWLDELCNYERDNHDEITDETLEWRKEIDGLYDELHEQTKTFNKKYEL